MTDAPDLFSVEDVRRRALSRLSLRLPDAPPPVHGGDHSLNPNLFEPDFIARARPAAVLIPIVARPEGATVLLTQRATAMRNHAGQIAFPGGKIDPADASPLDAALREAEEEIALPRATVTPLGYLDGYVTGSGFRIIPVVGLVVPPFRLVPNPSEVEDAFEVPFGFLMDPANHQTQSRDWRGRTRRFYAMPFGERNIWGATAGILRVLYDELYGR